VGETDEPDDTLAWIYDFYSDDEKLRDACAEAAERTRASERLRYTAMDTPKR
jgi:hypothetical protein